MIAKDMTGKKFGHLTVLERGANKNGGRAVWKCRCECGAIVERYGTDLRAGRTVSCGKCQCWHTKKDPYNRTRLYWVWHSMKNRCYNPKELAYKSYGGRGILVCDEWRDSFTAFRKWAHSNGYDENAPRGECTLDRIDVNGNYCPENCRWVDMKAQAENKRSADPAYEQEMFINKILIHRFGDKSLCHFRLTRPEDYKDKY